MATLHEPRHLLRLLKDIVFLSRVAYAETDSEDISLHRAQLLTTLG